MAAERNSKAPAGGGVGGGCSVDGVGGGAGGGAVGAAARGLGGGGGGTCYVLGRGCVRRLDEGCLCSLSLSLSLSLSFLSRSLAPSLSHTGVLSLSSFCYGDGCCQHMRTKAGSQGVRDASRDMHAHTSSHTILLALSLARSLSRARSRCRFLPLSRARALSLSPEQEAVTLAQW